MSELSMIFYKTVKHNSYCLCCHTTSNVQFHHVKAADKVAELHKIAKANELPALIEEMDKTLPLCDLHHREVHMGHREGWLDGTFNNGQRSHSRVARPYMPYSRWFTKQKPHVVKEFYVQHIERAHGAIWPLFNACGIAVPAHLRLALVEGSKLKPDNGPDNTPNLVA